MHFCISFNLLFTFLVLFLKVVIFISVCFYICFIFNRPGAKLLNNCISSPSVHLHISLACFHNCIPMTYNTHEHYKYHICLIYALLFVEHSRYNCRALNVCTVSSCFTMYAFCFSYIVYKTAALLFSVSVIFSRLVVQVRCSMPWF